MTPEAFARRWPRLYHVAAPDAWEPIRRFGLLATSTLLGRLDVPPAERRRLASARRPENVIFRDPRLGSVVLWDQAPTSERVLRSCLEAGMTPPEWFRSLNRRVFFWVGRDRTERLAAARSRGGRSCLVLTLDTGRFLAEHAARTSVASINTGSTRGAAARGPDTFVPLADFPDAAARRRGGRAVEVTVLDGIGAIERYVVRTTLHPGGDDAG